MKRIMLILALTGCGDLLGPGDEFRGSFAGGQYVETLTSPQGLTCTTVYSLSGEVRLNLKDSGSSVSGEGTVDINESPVSGTPGCGMLGPPRRFDVGGPISGTMSSFSFSGSYTSTGAGVSDVTQVRFTGSISNNTGSGTVTVEYSGTGVGEQTGNTTTGSGTVNVTLGR